jgi:hypothetical protein
MTMLTGMKNVMSLGNLRIEERPFEHLMGGVPASPEQSGRIARVHADAAHTTL